MSSVASINGLIRRAEEAQVSVYDRAFLYGDSVIETLRTYGGKPFALAEHLDRLAHSAESVLMDLPGTAEIFAREVGQALEAANNPESVIRIVATRGRGALLSDLSEVSDPQRIILIEPLVEKPALYIDGIFATTESLARASDSAPSAKIGNYLASILALARARKASAFEVIVLNEKGEVLEGTTSNVFARVGGVLMTPPPDLGLLAGITRRFVLEAAKGIGVEVLEKPFLSDALRNATEVFITSSLREIVPVVRIDGKPVANGIPQDQTRRLHEAFRELALGRTK